MREESLNLLARIEGRLWEQEPTLRVILWAWGDDPVTGRAGAQRVDVVVAYPADRHDGLQHWRDEWSWYEGDVFVHVLEASKFGRLGLKGHTLFSSVVAGALYRQSRLEWPADACDTFAMFDSVTSWVRVCRRYASATQMD